MLLLAFDDNIVVVLRLLLGEIKALTIHFEALRLFTVAPDLLYFLYFVQSLLFFPFLINVQSSKRGKTGSFLQWWYKCVISGKLQSTVDLRRNINILVLIIDLVIQIKAVGTIPFVRGVLNVHLILTVRLIIIFIVTPISRQ